MITRIDELARLDANRFEGIEEVLKERPDLFELVYACVGADRPRPVEFEVRSRVLNGASKSPRLYASYAARTTSTFSCDIAYSEIPMASRAFALSGSMVPSTRSIRPSRKVYRTVLHASNLMPLAAPSP